MVNKKSILLRALASGLLFFFYSGSLVAQDTEELITSGLQSYKQGDYRTAIEKFEGALQKDPQLPSSIVCFLGDSYEKVGDDDNAIKTYEKLFERASDNTYLRLVDLYLKKNKIDQVERVAKKLVERYPTGISSYLISAKLHEVRKEFKEAIDVLEKLLDINPRSPEAQKEIIADCVQSGDYDRAKKHLDTLVVLYPGTADPQLFGTYIQLAKIYGTKKQFDDATACWEQALKIEPPADKSEFIDFCLTLASQYAHDGRIDVALRYYLKVDSLGVATPDLQMLIAELYYRKGDFPLARDHATKALTAYKKEIESNPLSAEPYIKTGACYLVMGDLVSAEGECVKYVNRTKPEERAAAVKTLQGFISEEINTPDASYILNKYFSSVSEKLPEVVRQSSPSIIRDTVAPRIVIFSPGTQRGMKTTEVASYSTPVVGVAADDKGVSVVYVNGIVAQLSEASPDDIQRADIPGKIVKFTSNAMLSVGENQIEVQAVDINGNAARETVSVHRSPAKSIEKQEAVPATSTVKLPKIWAVVVGISKYQDKEINLEFADKDAQAFYGFLRSPSGGAVPDDRIELLTNRNATRAEIIRAINQKLRLAFDDDEVVLYFACHGIPDEVSNELYFMSYDADRDNIAGTGVSQTDIQKAIGSARAKKVLLITDACHSGGLGLAPAIAQRGDYASMTNRLLLQLSEARDGVGILSASSTSEYSNEGKRWEGHGVFTYYLLNGLSGAADKNNDGTVTLREIYEYVYDKVAHDTETKQHPVLQGKYDNDLPVSVIK